MDTSLLIGKRVRARVDVDASDRRVAPAGTIGTIIVATPTTLVVVWDTVCESAWVDSWRCEAHDDLQIVRN